jgi:hypothetical protein
MGYFGQWIVVQGARPSALQKLGLQPAAEEAASGWRYAFANDLPEDPGALIEHAARAGDGVALPRTRPENVRSELPKPPHGLSRELREAWDQLAEQGFYTQSSGAPWLILEEDEDDRWRVVMDFGGDGLANYLGDVTLGEWRMLPDDWPHDFASLGPAVLVLAGVG